MQKDEAIKLYEGGFWEELTVYEKVKFQLFEPLLCMPFEVFHAAVEEVLERPVYTHEFGINWEGLKKEFLGRQKPPSIEEIINLIPKDKRVLIWQN